jgi:hypothetical protein
MARSPIPVVGSYREDIITRINAERTINLYQVVPMTGKKDSYLHLTPGKKEIGTFSAGNFGRNESFSFKGFTYYVVGDTIYQVDATPTINAIALNFFTTITGHVGVAANENEIIFVDGIKAFLWNTTTSTGMDVTPNLPAGFAPLDVTFMDGSFILISGSVGVQNRFYISALNDGTTWNIGDFALINSRPTILNGVAVLKRRIFFFGQKSTEVWIDAGLAGFRFRRDNNLLFEHGVKAISSIAQGFDRLFYLSSDENGVGSIMMVTGVTPVAISDPVMDEKIQGYTAPEDAIGFVYKINGEIFYQINFTTDNHTFVYGVTSSEIAGEHLWHELEMLDGNRDIANSHTFIGKTHYMTSYKDSKLYELSPVFLDNNGEKIKRTRILRFILDPVFRRIRLNRFELDMLKGVGLINTKPISSYPPNVQPPSNASDVIPTVFLSLSNDGGLNYHTYGERSFGAAGERTIQIRWQQLGTYRDNVFKIEIFNAVPVYILDGALDYEVQPE